MSQRGGNPTFLPKEYYLPGKPCEFYQKQTAYNYFGHPISRPDQPEQEGGSPTPLPMAYFSPEKETRPGYLTAAQCEQEGGDTCTMSSVSPLPGKILNLNCHLSLLGNNAHVLTLDNRRRMYYTYKKTYGVDDSEKKALKALFKDPATWSEFRNADYVVGQVLEIINSRLMDSDSEGFQTGGGAMGAPFFIPDFGRNPRITSGQFDEESQETTGYSYKFKTRPGFVGFDSMWGSNLPTFNALH